MNNFFNKVISLSLLFFMMIGDISAQVNQDSSDSFLKDKISLSLGVTPFKEGGFNAIPISINGMYGINSWLEAGLFTEFSSDLFEVNSGVAAKAHLLPVVINPSYYRFDLYANMQLGVGSIYSEFWGTSAAFYIGGGIGAGFNINKNFGIFYELGYDNINYLNHKFGLKFMASQNSKTISTDSYIKDKITLSVGADIDMSKGFKQTMYCLSGLYGINGWLDAGLFTHIGQYLDNISGIEYYPTVICYGAATRMHLMPIIKHKSYYKFDLYLNMLLGAKSYIHKPLMINESTYTKRTAAFYTRTSIGAAYYFSKRIGIFYEFGFSNTDGLGNQLGLSVRL